MASLIWAGRRYFWKRRYKVWWEYLIFLHFVLERCTGMGRWKLVVVAGVGYDLAAMSIIIIVIMVVRLVAAVRRCQGSGCLVSVLGRAVMEVAEMGSGLGSSGSFSVYVWL